MRINSSICLETIALIDFHGSLKSSVVRWVGKLFLNTVVDSSLYYLLGSE